MQVTPIQPLEATARAILRGTCLFYDEDTPFGEDEWKLAADDALHGDDRDLRHMLRRQAAYDAYLEWRASAWSEREAERREWVSFEEFEQSRGGPSEDAWSVADKRRVFGSYR